MENNTTVTPEVIAGIKSKDRVKAHGEVFTPDSIVNDMLDLVDKDLKVDIKEEVANSNNSMTEDESYILKTFLEPACGNGNFLIRILDRKLEAVERLPEEKRELGLVQAVSSIYGIDIQADNVKESKERMKKLITDGRLEILELEGKEKKGFCGITFDLSGNLGKVIDTILKHNIVLGNALETRDTYIETNKDIDKFDRLAEEDAEKAQKERENNIKIHETVKFIDWHFDDEYVKPDMFKITEPTTPMPLNNTRNHWSMIPTLNYVYNDDLGSDW